MNLQTTQPNFWNRTDLRPREKRALWYAEAIARGDNRSAYLGTVDPDKRSEAAAVWDHQIEADELAGPVTQDDLNDAAVALVEGQIVAYLAEEGGYRDLVYRYMNKLLLSAGMEREISRARENVEPPTTEEIKKWAVEQRDRRLNYIRQRYGVTPNYEVTK